MQQCDVCLVCVCSSGGTWCGAANSGSGVYWFCRPVMLYSVCGDNAMRITIHQTDTLYEHYYAICTPPPHIHIVCVVQLLCTWHHTSTSIIIIIISATPDGHNLLRIWRNVSGDWVASKWSVISVCVVGEHVIDFNISSFFTLIILRELQRN